MTYHAYGRTLATDRPLPELEPSDALPDITIAWNARPPIPPDARWTTLWRFSTEEPWVTMTRANGVRHLRFGRFADVALSDGRIDVSRRGHASDATLRHLVLDQALPLALASRGALVVHASALVRQTRAIVIAGRAGAGKSTLAALLARDGWRVIADDGVVLEGRSPDVRVIGSYPGLRVYGDSADAAGLDVTESAGVAEYSRKLRVVPPKAAGRCQFESFTLAAMYSLRPGGFRVEFEKLARRDAAMEVLAHAYRSDPNDRASLTAQLDTVTAVAPDVWLVSCPRDLSRAAAFASAIAAHASSRDARCP
jgi:sarcosine oxidase gamma subunit